MEMLHPSTMVDGVVGGGVIHSKMMIDHERERDSIGYFKLDPRTSMGAFNKGCRPPSYRAMELFLFRCAQVVTP